MWRFGIVVAIAVALSGAATANTLEACDQASPPATKITICTDFIAKSKSRPERSRALNARGTAKSELGDISGALADYDAAAKLVPDDPYIHNNRGVLFRDRGEYDKALVQLDAAIRLRPDVALFHRVRGSINQALVRHEAAVGDFAAAVARDPKDERAHYLRAWSLNVLGKGEAALADVNQSLALQPKSLDVLLLKAAIEKGLKRFSDAIESCTTATEVEPKSARASECLGDAEELAGDTYSARRNYERAIALDAKFGLAHVGLGDVLGKQEEWVKAVESYSKALEHGAQKSYALSRRAQALSELKRYDEAKTDLDQALKITPDDQGLKYRLALLAAKTGRYDTTLAGLDAYIAANPKVAVAYRDRAEVYDELGDWRKAFADYDRYLALEPGDASALTARGKLHELLGDDVLALADHERAVRLAPDDYSAYAAWQSVYERRGELEVLLRRLSQRLATTPDDLQTLSSRMELFKKLDRPGYALADLRRLVAAHAKSKWRVDGYRLEIAQMLEAMGRRDEALRELGDAISMADGDGARARALRLRGTLRMAGGQVDEGIRDTLAAVGYQPFLAGIAASAAPTAHKARLVGDLLRQLSDDIARKPTASLHRERAKLLMDAQRNEEALADFAKAIQLEPSDKWLRSDRVTLLQKLGMTERAIEDLTSLIKAHDPTDLRYQSTASYVTQRARLYRELGRFDEAAADLESGLGRSQKVMIERLDEYRSLQEARGNSAKFVEELKTLAMQPMPVALLRARAEAYWASGATDAALADLKTILDIRPTDGDTLFYRSSLLADRGRYEDALVDRLKAVALAPREVRKLIAVAETHDVLGHRRDALAALTQAIELDPKSNIARSRRVWVHLLVGDLASATADAETADVLSPTATELVARGATHLAAGRHAAARVDFDRALELFPNWATVYYNRARLHAATGDRAAEVADAQKALDLMTKQAPKLRSLGPMVLGSMARLKLRLGDAAEAMTLSEKALAQAPNLPWLIETRALVLRAAGRHPEALADLKRVLSIDDQRADARTALAELTDQSKLTDQGKTSGAQPTNAASVVGIGEGAVAQPRPAAEQRAAPLGPVWAIVEAQFPDVVRDHRQDVQRLKDEKQGDKEARTFVAETIAKLRRRSAKEALAASPEKLRVVAVSYAATLTVLRRRGSNVCHSYIADSETSAPVLALSSDPDIRAAIDNHQIAVLHAIMDGRAMPRNTLTPHSTDFDILTAELVLLGWTVDDLKMFSDQSRLAKATPEKSCQLVADWIAAHLAIADPAVQVRLLRQNLRALVEG